MCSPVLNITSRTLAAIFGGYILAATSSVLLTLILPLSPLENALIAMMLSFSVYAAAIVWVFSVKTHIRAWRDLMGLSGFSYLCILLLG